MELIRPDELMYVHTVFLQCFLPLRHNDANRKYWRTEQGRAAIVIHAGKLVSCRFESRNLMSFSSTRSQLGLKARLISDYIMDYACRHKTREIYLGNNLQRAMVALGINIGGENGRSLQREMSNVAASEIIVGTWGADPEPNSKTKKRKRREEQWESAKVCEGMRFWEEEDEDKKRVWHTKMLMGERFYGTSHVCLPSSWMAVGKEADYACSGSGWRHAEELWGAIRSPPFPCNLGITSIVRLLSYRCSNSE